MTRTYSELIRFKTFHDRFNYLKLSAKVGGATFGYDRFLNQAFYQSREWKRARRDVLLRDNGCDLGLAGHEILYRPLIHHMNPLTVEEVERGDLNMLDPEFLICVSHATHNAIHYGDDQTIQMTEWRPREPGDTKLW